MSIEDDPHAAALLETFRRTLDEIAMLRQAFVIDAIESGRHTPSSMADLLERAGKAMPGYEGSAARACVEAIRTGGLPGLRLIRGGKEED